MHETIRVFEDEEGVLRTDHILKLRGITFLKLHYKIIPKAMLVNTQSGEASRAIL